VGIVPLESTCLDLSNGNTFQNAKFLCNFLRRTLDKSAIISSGKISNGRVLHIPVILTLSLLFLSTEREQREREQRAEREISSTGQCSSQLLVVAHQYQYYISKKCSSQAVVLVAQMSIHGNYLVF
jgi:hypothetical protein